MGQAAVNPAAAQPHAVLCAELVMLAAVVQVTDFMDLEENGGKRFTNRGVLRACIRDMTMDCCVCLLGYLWLLYLVE